jgi:PleD family two-component response regulator
MPNLETQVNRTSILIVDDREENLLALEGWLDDFDLNIVKATSGNEALARMLEEDFALVLLDVQMPGIDGFETAELMRGTERTRTVPIIFVTAISKEEKHIFKGYETGAVDYIFKPLDPHILRSKVTVFVNLHRQNKELERTVAELRKALEKVKKLSGLLPICSHCKKIRDDTGYWNQVETYIHQHTGAEFSHGICKECAQKHYPGMDIYED